jgi:hypothetical protein
MILKIMVEVTVTGSAKSIFEYEVAGAYALVVRTKKKIVIHRYFL